MMMTSITDIHEYAEPQGLATITYYYYGSLRSMTYLTSVTWESAAEAQTPSYMP